MNGENISQRVNSEIIRQAKRVMGDARTFRKHPRQITKAEGLAHLHRLKGAVELMFATWADWTSDDAKEHVHGAYDEARTWLTF